MEELTKPFVFENGLGAIRVVADQYLDELLEARLNAPTEHVRDEMKVLADVNRRVAAEDSSVSPYCQVSFINADDSFAPAGQLFTEEGESVPFHMPVLLFGIDLSGMAETFMSSVQSGETQEFNLDQMNKQLKRRP
jgi:hypothetical protein